MGKEHLARMIREKIQAYGPKTALRYKDGLTGQWRDISWNSLGEQIQAVAEGLIELGVREGDSVGIFSQNKPEWTIADYGIQSVGAVSVPIYATSSAKQVRFIVDNAGINVLFVGDGDQYEKAKSVSAESLTRIIAFSGDVEPDEPRALSFRHFLDLGSKSHAEEEINSRLERASPQDIATIIYTSGTTGDPKGVMLTHSNFFHQMEAVDRVFKLRQEDVSLCFLPLSHVFERSWSYIVLRQGAVICYCDDPGKVIEYIRETRPTAMVAVPRLYEKAHAAVIGHLKSMHPLKQKLFHWAFNVGRERSELLGTRKPVDPILRMKHFIADRLILKKIRNIFGGRTRFLFSGGAPLSREIAEFFYSAGMLICEGYGLTETSPTITYNHPGCFKFGTVGKVVPRCEVKLSQEGEVLVRGDNVTPGYYKNPEATSGAFENGWFKTGDVGEFDEEGFLRITDRIKDLIITSGGKNISPQNVQTNLMRDELIEQVVVIGDRRKYLSALIVPAFDALENYARSNNVPFSSREELVRNPQIISLFEKRIEMQSEDLGDYERIKKFTLLPREFTQEAGEMTPTLKLKRKIIHEKYSSLIEAMYE